MVGHIFKIWMPQEPNPVVRTVTRVAAWLGFSPGSRYRAVQTRPTNPMFRKVAEKPPREKKLVEDRVGLLKMRHRPVSISARSGMQKAAIRKLRLKAAKKRDRKSRSDKWFNRFIGTPLNLCSKRY